MHKVRTKDDKEKVGGDSGDDDDEKEKKDDDFEEEEMEAGDEFMAVKPWLGAMKPPTNFAEKLNVQT